MKNYVILQGYTGDPRGISEKVTSNSDGFTDEAVVQYDV